jgi:hypothetical protein
LKTYSKASTQIKEIFRPETVPNEQMAQEKPIIQQIEDREASSLLEPSGTVQERKV